MSDHSRTGGDPAPTVLPVGAITAASFLVFAFLARSPVPAWDDWAWLTWLLSAPPTPSRLILPHNEHVIPIARLLHWLQYRLQGANGSLLFWISMTSQVAVGALFWREIAQRWPHNRALRQTALGGSLLTLFSAWQLHSIVLASSILFPLVLVFAVLAIAMGLTAIGRADRARVGWAAGSLAASLGAMLTTTNGIIVPAIVAAIVATQRSARTLAVAHAILALTASALYATLVLSAQTATSGGVAFVLAGLPIITGFFFAVFAPFVTYGNTVAGVIAGGLLVSAGLAVSVSILKEWSQAPRIERFAIGVMAFTLASTLMTAFGRAPHFGIEYAAQSRYATYSMAYWAALLLMILSATERGAAPRLVGALAPAARVLAVPVAIVLLAIHGVSGLIWIAKADNLTAAGLAVAANTRDDGWIRTLHSSVDVVYRARALAAVDGDRTVVGADVGRHATVPASTTLRPASLSVTPAPEDPALRLTGTAQIDARTGWVLDSDGMVVGLAARAPLVEKPDASGAEVFAALRHSVVTGSMFSSTRWIGFAPASARQPLTFVAVESGRVVCRSPLSWTSIPNSPVRTADARTSRGVDQLVWPRQGARRPGRSRCR